MIDAKTLTCSNCHGGDFIRLDDNEFKCTHCNSITIVQDDVAQRLEQILLQMQASAAAPSVTHAKVSQRGGWIVAALVVAALVLFIVGHVFDRPGSFPSRSAGDLPPVDPGLVKIQDLHPAPKDGKIIGLVRNDSDRVINDVTIKVQVKDGAMRKDDQSASMSGRMLPGESRPIVFTWWSPANGESFDIAEKDIRTEDDFAGRVSLSLKHEQLIGEDDRLRFIGQLVNADAFPAKSIKVSVQLLDGKGRLIGDGDSSPESGELARGETTRFDVSITRYDDADITSMQYVVDSERVTTGDQR